MYIKEVDRINLFILEGLENMTFFLRNILCFQTIVKFFTLFYFFIMFQIHKTYFNINS